MSSESQSQPDETGASRVDDSPRVDAPRDDAPRDDVQGGRRPASAENLAAHGSFPSSQSRKPDPSAEPAFGLPQWVPGAQVGSVTLHGDSVTVEGAIDPHQNARNGYLSDSDTADGEIPVHEVPGAQNVFKRPRKGTFQVAHPPLSPLTRPVGTSADPFELTRSPHQGEEIPLDKKTREREAEARAKYDRWAELYRQSLAAGSGDREWLRRELGVDPDEPTSVTIPLTTNRARKTLDAMTADTEDSPSITRTLAKRIRDFLENPEEETHPPTGCVSPPDSAPATAVSTGNHLHFEKRPDGASVVKYPLSAHSTSGECASVRRRGGSEAKPYTLDEVTAITAGDTPGAREARHLQWMDCVSRFKPGFEYIDLPFDAVTGINHMIHLFTKDVLPVRWYDNGHKAKQLDMLFGKRFPCAVTREWSDDEIETPGTGLGDLRRPVVRAGVQPFHMWLLGLDEKGDDPGPSITKTISPTGDAPVYTVEWPEDTQFIRIVRFLGPAPSVQRLCWLYTGSMMKYEGFGGRLDRDTRATMYRQLVKDIRMIGTSAAMPEYVHPEDDTD